MLYCSIGKGFRVSAKILHMRRTIPFEDESKERFTPQVLTLRAWQISKFPTKTQNDQTTLDMLSKSKEMAESTKRPRKSVA